MATTKTTHLKAKKKETKKMMRKKYKEMKAALRNKHPEEMTLHELNFELRRRKAKLKKKRFEAARWKTKTALLKLIRAYLEEADHVGKGK